MITFVDESVDIGLALVSQHTATRLPTGFRTCVGKRGSATAAASMSLL